MRDYFFRKQTNFFQNFLLQVFLINESRVAKIIPDKTASP